MTRGPLLRHCSGYGRAFLSHHSSCQERGFLFYVTAGEHSGALGPFAAVVLLFLLHDTVLPARATDPGQRGNLRSGTLAYDLEEPEQPSQTKGVPPRGQQGAKLSASRIRSISRGAASRRSTSQKAQVPQSTEFAGKRWEDFEEWEEPWRADEDVEEYGGKEKAKSPQGVTTVMLREIPNELSREDVIRQIRERGFGIEMDFLYLPAALRPRQPETYCRRS